MSMDERAEDEIDIKDIHTITSPRTSRSSRRQLLRQMAGFSLGASLGAPLTPWKSLPLFAQAAARQQAHPASTVLSADDDNFLDDLERANFLYFWEQANPQTGLIKDRCTIRGKDT